MEVLAYGTALIPDVTARITPLGACRT